MAKSLPPLTWFRAFDAAARNLNFTLAADELGLTQSAVSQQIRALETRLGTPLFLRRPKGLALTDAGRRLVPDVAAAMARLQDATAALLPATGTDVLTVATSVSIAQWYIAPRMAALQKALPGLRLRLITAVWQDEFSAAEADVEIRFGSAEVAGRGATPLGSFDLVAVAAPALGGRWETVASLPLIQPVGVTETWARILRQSGMTQDIEPAIFTDSHGLAVDLALSGAGVALTSAIIAAPALADGRLVDLGPARIRGSEGYFLAVSDPGNAPAVAFADWLRAAIMSR